MLNKLILLILLCCSCSLGPVNLQSRHSSDLEARALRRIAVLPPGAAAGQKAKIPFTTPVGEMRASEREAPDLLAKLVHTAMATLGNWQIVAESEVREVDPGGASISDAARLRHIGEMVYADAVMSGTMLRFRERVGEDWGAKSPASVAFILELVDVRRGDVVWSARYDETQKSLSENIFAVFDVGQRGLRWLSAEELTHDGVRKAVGQLHQILTRSAAP
jgi:TolB-like protein